MPAIGLQVSAGRHVALLHVVTARTRLNGWKEIAAHFGKGVRTVQRWEQVYGLPVRRVAGEGGEIVYAFVEELDEWEDRRRSHRHWTAVNGLPAEDGVPEPTAPPGAASADTEAEPPPLPTRGPTSSEPRRQVARIALLLASLGALGAIAWTLAPSMPTSRHAGATPRVPGPARVALDGDRLRAYDGNEAVLWEHVLEQKQHLHPPLTTLVDLDHDGRNEVVVRVTGVRLDSRPFLVLGSDGHALLARSPQDTVRFGDTAYTPPWLSHRSFVTEGPDRASTLWLAFTHGLFFPEIVEAYDRTGAPLARYWSNGYVNLVSEARLGRADMVFIGATNNESRGASLAFFDHGQVRGSAPAEQEKYRCVDCPPGRPREFLVFPRTCIDHALDEQPNVSNVVPYADGRLVVTVDTGAKSAGTLFYEFGPDLTLLRIEIGKEFRSAHLDLEREGRIDHRYDDDEFKGLQPVRRWMDSRFVALPTAPVEKR